MNILMIYLQRFNKKVNKENFVYQSPNLYQKENNTKEEEFNFQKTSHMEINFKPKFKLPNKVFNLFS